jgi:hypothetical protein
MSLNKNNGLGDFMEAVWKGALRLVSSVCLVALAACSGGGGGNSLSTTANNSTPSNNTTSNNTTSNNTTSNNSTSNNTTSNNTPALVTITAPDNPSAGGSGAANNFSTNLPPVGTQFGLPGTIVKVTSTSIGGAGLSASARSMDQAIYEGVVTSNGVTYPVFNLNVPSLGFTANNVRGDGTTAATSTGGTVTAAVATLNYTVLGAWTYTPPGGGTTYLGQTASGFLTPDSGIPTTGNATYVGNGSSTGGVVGAYAVNTSNGVQIGTLSGNVSITANFGPNNLSGTMTNMSATAAGSSTPQPWNNVTLSGFLGVNQPITKNTFTGTTAASAAPSGSGSAAFTTAAQGQFAGEFYGPNAQELGATWTLYEPTNGGKAAFGTIAATATTTP